MTIAHLFGIVIPYLAIIVFIVGVTYRIYKWAKVPVPFRTPTTCGQQKSLPWIAHNRLESPFTLFDVVLRMALEVLCFRSLFRNTRAEFGKDGKIVYGSSKWLWIGAMAFHWAFLIVFLRHMRFFTNPMPRIFDWIDKLDSLFQIGSPPVYATSVVLGGALLFLLARRVLIPQMRYISLPADYVPLFLLLGIVATGCLMRYTPLRAPISDVKQIAMGLVTFQPPSPLPAAGCLFYIHLTLVSVFFIYFPFSKLMHMGGVFLSPARNLANNSRAKRHINPWNPTVKVHTYEEWEDEFRDKIKGAGLPLEKE